MELKTRSGKKRAKRTKTDENQIDSVLGMLDLCALNFPGDGLGKLAADAATTLRKFNEAIDKHEAEK